MPLISVVIPAFNPDPVLLCRAVVSALRQSYAGIEVIIADDGSSIPVEETLRASLPCNDDDWRRIVVTRSDRNEGISCARNRAAELSSGDWLIWLDADDVLDTNCIECLLAAAENADLVIGECVVIEGNGMSRRKPTPYFEEAKRYFGTPRDPFLLNIISLQPQLVHRSIFKSLGGFNHDYRWAEMSEFFLRYLARHGLARVKCVNDAVYYYFRGRPDSVSSDRRNLMEYRQRCLRTYMQEHKIANHRLAYKGRNLATGMQEYELLREEHATWNCQ